jgi:hypothetical protein
LKCKNTSYGHVYAEKEGELTTFPGISGFARHRQEEFADYKADFYDMPFGGSNNDSTPGSIREWT